MLQQATKSLSKMHVRRNPNLSIESTASYSQLSPALQSAASGAFLSPTVASRRGLLARSPPPSPSLPSLIHRHGRKQRTLGSAQLWKRAVLGFCGVAVVVWLVLSQVYGSGQRTASYDGDGEEWEMVGGNKLPQEASAVAVQDAAGKMRWTVSIPASYDFPLRPEQYSHVCHQSHELAMQVRQDAQKANNIAKRMLGYYQKDEYYIDVQDAEAQALLPPSKAEGRPKGFVDDEAIASGLATAGLKVCDKTLTYVLETEDAGFGSSLMRLWMAYGLAKAEGRTFFLDDTRWPYGKYLTYFANPPTAGCLPPPKTQMVPCPHNARHIVVSAATVGSTFGHSFTDEWEDPTKMRVQRQHKIFGLLRTGYEALFKLRGDDAKYVLNRALDLYGAVKSEGGLSIGMHVRHGDKHPLEYQYQSDYIPLDRYVETARELYIDIVESSPDQSSHNHKSRRHTSSKMILASDDPLVYESPELGPNSIRAQDRIMLATKATLEAAQGKKNPWIDEITGWEGGFYRSVFLSLGQPVGNAGDMAALDADNVPAAAMRLRELVARAYLLDLAVLGKADSMVCTVSSTACRLLAVMMGWEKAFVMNRWRNIDGEFDWKGIVW